MILTKQAILKPKKLKREVVEVPEWGGDVLVQEMTATQRDAFEDWSMTQRKEDTHKGTRVMCMINTVVDENGKPIFTDLDAPDLLKQSGIIINRIAQVGLELSGLAGDSVEEELKNSETVPQEDSLSDSAKN